MTRFGHELPKPLFTIAIDRETDGRWIADISSVPGALAYGWTILEAVKAALEIAGKEQ